MRLRRRAVWLPACRGQLWGRWQIGIDQSYMPYLIGVDSGSMGPPPFCLLELCGWIICKGEGKLLLWATSLDPMTIL
jgi:hypothetical protein